MTLLKTIAIVLLCIAAIPIIVIFGGLLWALLSIIVPCILAIAFFGVMIYLLYLYLQEKALDKKRAKAKRSSSQIK